MKEKTADIDILEEKRLGAYLAVLNEENILYKKEDAIEGIIKLFKTLIAENKELKKEKDRVGKLYYEANENCIKYEKLIIKIDEILDKYKYTEIEDSEKIIQFYKELQSLLGKE